MVKPGAKTLEIRPNLFTKPTWYWLTILTPERIVETIKKPIKMTIEQMKIISIFQCKKLNVKSQKCFLSFLLLELYYI